MRCISLHTKYTSIVYKNSICSTASLVVVIFVLLSVMVPVLLVSLLSPYAGISESRVLYEQPRVRFQFQSIFVAQTTTAEVGTGTAAKPEDELLACSTNAAFNERMQRYSKHCMGSTYWSEDLNHDGLMDRAHFQLQLDASSQSHLQSYELALFFEAKLQHKCALSPPALLTQRLIIPAAVQLGSGGTIHLKTELQLKQHTEFSCPYPGRDSKTYFTDVVLPNGNDTDGDVNMERFRMESLLEQLKTNAGYFELQLQETYFRGEPSDVLRLQLEIDVRQVATRYHLSVWERLGQFWLYFASFFGVTFYVLNKLKDFLFGSHIIRSWEIVPWKKLY